jgi:hypothetical protein
MAIQSASFFQPVSARPSAISWKARLKVTRISSVDDPGRSTRVVTQLLAGRERTW